MNNTKWHELLDAMMEKVPNNCMKYKTIFEDDEPAEYWDIFSDEELAHMNLAEIEWLKISSILKESRYIGALLPCQITEYDKKEEILQIMREYNIPYEYDENEKIFIVYGYK